MGAAISICAMVVRIRICRSHSDRRVAHRHGSRAIHGRWERTAQVWNGSDGCRIMVPVDWNSNRLFVLEDDSSTLKYRTMLRRAMKDYHINIFFSAEDGGYIADIPDLAACSAFGKTQQEALRQVQIAKKAWLAA